MKLQTSYFSLSLPLIRENLRRFWAIPCLSFLIYFFSGIFPILISYSDINKVSGYIKISLMNMQPFFLATHLIMPIITAVIIFRYLQSTSSVTMIHSMPFSRMKLYTSNLFSGLLLIVTPIILSGGILLIIARPAYEVWNNDPVLLANAANVFTRGMVLEWIWQSIIIVFVIYSISVFAGIVTANSIMHFATGFAFNFLVPSLYAIFVYYFSINLYGFNISGDWYRDCLSITPFLQVFNGKDGATSFPAMLQIYYILNGIILILLSGYLYTKRKLEKATESLAFTFMLPLICYFVAFL